MRHRFQLSFIWNHRPFGQSFDMVEGTDGAWAVTTTPLVAGLHYYPLVWMVRRWLGRQSRAVWKRSHPGRSCWQIRNEPRRTGLFCFSAPANRRPRCCCPASVGRNRLSDSAPRLFRSQSWFLELDQENRLERSRFAADELWVAGVISRNAD